MTCRAGLLAALLLLVAAPSALAVSPIAAYDDATKRLTVTGTTGADTITVGHTDSYVVVTSPAEFTTDPDDAGTDCDLLTGSVRCKDAEVTTVVVNALGGADALTKDDDRVGLRGGAGNDTLIAMSVGFAPTDTGGDDNDTFNGSAAEGDVLIAETGGDTYRLGTDTDVGDAPSVQFDAAPDLLDYGARTGPQAVSGDNVANDGDPGGGDDVGADIESIYSGSGDDVLAAGPNATYFFGAGGGDRITGGAGPDLLYGGAGPDAIIGGGGDDYLSDGDSTAITGPQPPAFDDTLDGGDGNDTLEADRGADDLHGGAGEDLVTYDRPISPTDEASFTVTVDDAANDGVTGADERDNVHTDLEQINTSGGNDVVTGSGGNESFSTGRGNDTITGGGGVDAVYAGRGADTVFVQDGITERVDCGDDGDAVTADLPGAQPERADVLLGCETVTGTPFAPLPVATTPPVVDVEAPAVTLKAKTVKVKPFLKDYALPVSVTCGEACTAAGEAFTSSASIDKVGQLSIGTGKLTSGTGKRTMEVKVSKKAFRKALKRKLRTKKQRRKGIKLTVTVTVRDAAGNDGQRSISVRVRG